MAVPWCPFWQAGAAAFSPCRDWSPRGLQGSREKGSPSFLQGCGAPGRGRGSSWSRSSCGAVPGALLLRGGSEGLLGGPGSCALAAARSRSHSTLDLPSLCCVPWSLVKNIRKTFRKLPDGGVPIEARRLGEPRLLSRGGLLGWRGSRRTSAGSPGGQAGSSSHAEGAGRCEQTRRRPFSRWGC